MPLCVQTPADQLKPGDRDSAKRVVYAVIYGIGKEQLGMHLHSLDWYTVAS
jgi:hypothetical protein